MLPALRNGLLRPPPVVGLLCRVTWTLGGQKQLGQTQDRLPPSSQPLLILGSWAAPWDPPAAGVHSPWLGTAFPNSSLSCLALTTADDGMTCYAFPPPHGPAARPAANISSHPPNTVTSQGSPPELPPSRTFSDPPQTLTSLRFMVDPSSSPGICFLSFHIDSCTFKVQESNAPLMH